MSLFLWRLFSPQSIPIFPVNEEELCLKTSSNQCLFKKKVRLNSDFAWKLLNLTVCIITFVHSPSSLIDFLPASWPRPCELFLLLVARFQSGSEWAFFQIHIHLSEWRIAMHQPSTTPANIKETLLLLSKPDYCSFTTQNTYSHDFLSLSSLQPLWCYFSLNSLCDAMQLNSRTCSVQSWNQICQWGITWSA